MALNEYPTGGCQLLASALSPKHQQSCRERSSSQRPLQRLPDPLSPLCQLPVGWAMGNLAHGSGAAKDACHLVPKGGPKKSCLDIDHLRAAHSADPVTRAPVTVMAKKCRQCSGRRIFCLEKAEHCLSTLQVARPPRKVKQHKQLKLLPTVQD